MDPELTHVVLDDGTVVIRPWADFLAIMAEAVTTLEPDDEDSPCP